MLKKILAGALVLGLLGSVAYAADDQAAVPAQPQAQAQDDAGPDGVQQGWWHRHMAGHRHDMRGEMREPGGPGMMMGRQGFRLQLGPNVSVGIMCGTQAMKDCIAEAQPLIDTAKTAATQVK